MKKILIHSIIDVFYSYKGRLHYIIEYLLKNWYEVLLLHYRDIRKNEIFFDENYYKKLWNFESIYINQIKNNVLNPKIFELSKIHQLKFLKNISILDYDTYFNYWGLGFWYFLAQKINWKSKVIYDIADDLPEFVKTSWYIKNPLLKNLSYFYTKFLVQKNINISNYTTLTTNTLLDWYKYDNKKIIIFPNWIDKQDLNNYFENKNFLEQKYEKYNSLFKSEYDLYLGSLNASFVDIENLIQQYVKIKRKLLIVWNDIENLNKIISNFDKENKYIFSAWNVPHKDIWIFIDNAKFCHLPFKKNKISDNAFPLKVIEYMFYWKPTIAPKLETLFNTFWENWSILYFDSFEQIWKIINQNKDNIQKQEYKNFVKNISYGYFREKLIEKNLITII